MERPGEGLVRRAGRLERELRQDRRARVKELSEIRGIVGFEKSALDEGLRSLQDRVDALEQQLADGLKRERLAREGDVHELNELLKHEIIAREGLSSSMHEVFMSNLGAFAASVESQMEQLGEERKQPRVTFFEEDRAAHDASPRQEVAERAVVVATPEWQGGAAADAPGYLAGSGSDSDNPEVTRSSLEQQLAGIKAHLDRLEEIPLEHHQDDVHDFRRLLDCEQSAREDQLRSVEASLAHELEGTLASALGMLSPERQTSSACEAPEGEMEEKQPEQKRPRSTSRSSRGSLGSKLQVQYMRLAQEKAGGSPRRLSRRSSGDDELSADVMQTSPSAENARVEDQRHLVQWSMQQTV